MISHATSPRSQQLNGPGGEAVLRTPFVPFRSGDSAVGKPRTLGLHLTARQLEVLNLLCSGLPNKLICRRLNISAGTAKAHISNILRELGVSSRLQAVVAAGRLGLVERSEGAQL